MRTDNVCVHQSQLLDEYFGRKLKRYFVPHMPHFFVKSIFQRLPPRFKSHLLATSRRPFRSMSDVHTAYLFNNFILESGLFEVELITTQEKPPLLANPTYTIYLRSLDHKEYDQGLSTLRFLIDAKRNETQNLLPAFVSVNDDMAEHTDPIGKLLFEEFFRVFFPHACSVELT